jgi:AcrR family transcriptional regulator
LSQKSSTDLRVQRTRRLLQDALVQLMKEKPFREIQITEIADRAQVARPTFYLHYQSKQELLLSNVDAVFAEFYNELTNDIVTGNGDRKAHCILLFQYWARYADTLRMVVEADIHKELRDRLRKYCALVMSELPLPTRKSPIDKQSTEFIIDFVAGGAYMLLTHWIMQDMPCSAEQMGLLFYELTTPATLRFAYEQASTIQPV